MINKEIKVCWIEYKYMPSIERWMPFIGEHIVHKYNEEKIKSKVRKNGTIIDFTTNIFGKTKAIIDSGDNKIVKININKLQVVHKHKVR